MGVAHAVDLAVAADDTQNILFSGLKFCQVGRKGGHGFGKADNDGIFCRYGVTFDDGELGFAHFQQVRLQFVGGINFSGSSPGRDDDLPGAFAAADHSGSCESER